MFDVKLLKCSRSYLNQLPPFALAMMDAQPLISKICVCRTKDVTSGAGSCTFEGGTLLKSTVLGAVFFCCMATYLLGVLQKSKRTDCRISELEREERDSADLLRAEVVKLLERESDFLSRNETNWQFLLDRDLDNHYVSISSRIQDMKKPVEYARYLEITAMTFIIKSPIEVYQVRGNDLHLLARLPTEAYGTREPVRIAYTMDTQCRVHAGHFDLIVVLDKHDTSYSGTVLENAVMLGDTADDDIKNLPLAYVIDLCSQSSSLSSAEAATPQSAIQTSSDPAASREL